MTRDLVTTLVKWSKAYDATHEVEAASGRVVLFVDSRVVTQLSPAHLAAVGGILVVACGRRDALGVGLREPRGEAAGYRG